MCLEKDTVRLLAPKSEAQLPARTDRLATPRWEMGKCEEQTNFPTHTHTHTAPLVQRRRGERGEGECAPYWSADQEFERWRGLTRSTHLVRDAETTTSRFEGAQRSTAHSQSTHTHSPKREQWGGISAELHSITRCSNTSEHGKNRSSNGAGTHANGAVRHVSVRRTDTGSAATGAGYHNQFRPSGTRVAAAEPNHRE